MLLRRDSQVDCGYFYLTGQGIVSRILFHLSFLDEKATVKAKRTKQGKRRKKITLLGWKDRGEYQQASYKDNDGTYFEHFTLFGPINSITRYTCNVTTGHLAPAQKEVFKNS